MALKKKPDSSNADLVKFEKIGQSLTGHYLGTSEITIEGRPVARHLFATKEGTVAVLGQKHLVKMLEGIEVGTLVRATYTGTKQIKKGFNPMKVFELEYDEEDRLDSAALASINTSNDNEPDYETAEDTTTPEEVEPVQVPAPSRAALNTRTPVSSTAEQTARARAMLTKRQ